jgi:GNAT superfamily N-acetyltransferase
MIKIRALRPGELKQVLALLSRYSDRESEYSVLRKMQQLYIPLHRLSQLLPLNCQFMPGIFVAVAWDERGNTPVTHPDVGNRDKVLGLVWLSRDGRHSRRWKIDHLVLDPDASSYDVGTQLINYVINRYGGDGVQTFLAYVDQYYNTGLALLKSCGFRRCGRIHYFSRRGPLPARAEEGYTPPAGLRESRSGDASRLAVLYNDMLPPEARICLEKSARDFRSSLPMAIGEKFRGGFFKRWVVEDAARNCLVAAIDISTRDYAEFYLDLLVHPAWEILYEEVLAYAIRQVSGMTGQAILHTDCFEFCRKGLETLEGAAFQRNAIAEVLVKDYWIPLEDKEGSRLQSPLLVFSGRTSPA